MSKENTSEIRSIVREHVRKYFGSSPQEVQETYKVLEGFTPAEIRRALITHGGKQPRAQPIDMETEEMNKQLKGLAPKEVIRALKAYRIKYDKR